MLAPGPSVAGVANSTPGVAPQLSFACSPAGEDGSGRDRVYALKYKGVMDDRMLFHLDPGPPPGPKPGSGLRQWVSGWVLAIGWSSGADPPTVLIDKTYHGRKTERAAPYGCGALWHSRLRPWSKPDQLQLPASVSSAALSSGCRPCQCSPPRRRPPLRQLAPKALAGFRYWPMEAIDTAWESDLTGQVARSTVKRGVRRGATTCHGTDMCGLQSSRQPP